MQILSAECIFSERDAFDGRRGLFSVKALEIGIVEFCMDLIYTLKTKRSIKYNSAENFRNFKQTRVCLEKFSVNCCEFQM